MFPQAMVFDAYYELCGFEGDEMRRKNGHVTGISALATTLDPSGKAKLIQHAGRARFPYYKGKNGMQRPAFRINYPALKNAIEERMEEYHVADHVDIQLEADRILAKIDEYHYQQLESGWEYRPSEIKSMEIPTKPSRTAHRNKPGAEPAYVVKEGGEIVFASDELDSINYELGEAWVEDAEYGDGSPCQVLHHTKTGKQTLLGSTYAKPHGRMMIEKVFPFYIYDRTI